MGPLLAKTAWLLLLIWALESSCSCLAARAQSFPLKNARLIYEPEKAISAAFTYRVEAPSLQAENWLLYAPYPPEIPGQQKLTGLQFFLDDTESRLSAKEELSSLHRKILFKQIPATSASLKTELDTRVNYFLALRARSLAAGAEALALRAKGQAASSFINTEQLSSSQQAAYLQASTCLDFKNQTFQDFLDKQRLRRNAGELDIDFAWRSFLVIKRLYTYDYNPEQDRAASKVCTERKSDCGGLSFLHTSVLRANGIPARSLIGRWLKAEGGEDNSANSFGQVHVKSEFWSAKIGWVPVDMSLAVSDKTGAAIDHFGRFGGDFVCFHVDPDLLLDSIWFGNKEIRYMQSPLFWVTGAGSLANLTVTKVWQSRK